VLTSKDPGIGHNSYDILNPVNHPKLWIEVDWMIGAEPDYSTENTEEPLDSVYSLIDKVSDRSYVKVLKEDYKLSVPNSGTNAGKLRSLKEIKEIETKHRSIKTTQEIQSVYILYVDGGYDEDGNITSSGDKTLGMTYSSTSLVIFKKNIDRIDLNKLPSTLDIDDHDEIEQAVILHEFGKLLGMKCHDDKEDIMHSSLNSTRFTSELNGKLPREFSNELLLELNDIHMGIDTQTVYIIDNGTQEDLIVEVKFADNFDDDLHTVSLQYRSSEGKTATVMMDYKSGYYYFNIGGKLQNEGGKYMIKTRNSDGRTLTGTDTRIEGVNMVPENPKYISAGGKEENNNIISMVLGLIFISFIVLIIILGRKARKEEDN